MQNMHAGLFCDLSMPPEPKTITNYLCVSYRKFIFCFFGSVFIWCWRKIVELLLFGSNISNILDFPTGGVLFTRAQFLRTPVKLAWRRSEEKKNKPNTGSSVHGNGVKWGYGQFATPADMHESAVPLFNSLLRANLSLKSSGRRPPALWAGTVGAAGQRRWRDHRGGWCCFRDVIQIGSESRSSVTIIITL